MLRATFPDGRPSRFIYWDDLPGRRMRPDMVDRAVGERVAKVFVRTEQHALNRARRRMMGWISLAGASNCEL